MRKFLLFLFCFLLLCYPVLAVDDLGEDGVILTDVNQVYDLEYAIQLASDTANTLADSLITYEDDSSTPSVFLSPGSDVTDISVQAVNPITPSNSTGFKKVLLSLIGNYDAVVVQYQTSSSGYYSTAVQLDYPWLFSAGIFALVLFCTLKFIGSIFGGRK